MSDPVIVGSTVRFQITVTDPDTGDLTAATSVDLTVTDPAGIESTPAVTNPSTGVYQSFVDLDQEGWFTATWTVTLGSFVTVKECAVCAGATVVVGV